MQLRGPGRIEAIPSDYAGIKFRSRLEASWAAYWDAHDIAWAYESEGFDLDGIWYLPDFFLPDTKTVVEVKGMMTRTDEAKIAALAWHGAQAGVLTVVAEAPVGRRYAVVNPNEATKVTSVRLGPTTRLELLTDVSLVRCASCRQWYYVVSGERPDCRACGYHGDVGTFDRVHEQDRPTSYSSQDCDVCNRGWERALDASGKRRR